MSFIDFYLKAKHAHLNVMKKTVYNDRLPKVLILIAVVASVSFVRNYARHFDNNLSGFACIGDEFPNPYMRDDVFVNSNSSGYDGQFFFVSAHDPFLVGIGHRYLDAPAYRSQRLSYPLLVWILSLGRHDLIPLMMIVVNVAAIVLSLIYLMMLFRAGNNGIFWAMLIVFNGGMMLSLARDLSEPVSVAFLLAAMFYHLEKKPYWAILFMSLAVLGRELLILIPAFFALDYLIKGVWKSMLVWCIPGLVFAGWQTYVFFRIGELPQLAGGGNFGFPLLGIKNYLEQLWQSDSNKWEWRFAISVLVFVVFSLFTALSSKQFKVPVIRVILLIFCVMPMFFSDLIWAEPWSYGRVMLPQIALFMTYTAMEKPRISTYISYASIAYGGYAMLKWLSVF